MARPVKIGNAVREILNAYGIYGKVRAAEAIRIWPEVVGERNARVSRAVRMQDGVLFVQVSGSAWRQELTFLRREFVAKLNESLGEKIVQDIRFI